MKSLFAVVALAGHASGKAVKTTMALVCAGLVGCAPWPPTDGGADAGLDSGVAYEVLDGGLFKFLDGRGRSCDDACAELGLDCSGAFYNGGRIAGLYDYGECRRLAQCAKDWSGAGLCYSDRPPYPMQWMACGCVPFRDAGP